MNKKLLATVAVAPTLALSLSACNQQSQDEHADHKAAEQSVKAVEQSDKADAKPHNASDIAFAQAMMVHHQQALEISDILLSKGPTNQPLIVLATQIKAAQQPEIDQMKKLLTEWKAPETADHSAHSMDGMLDEATVTTMKSDNVEAAQKLYVDSMIVHHQGAVKMAQDELANGQNEEAKQIAQNIVDTQNKEIATLQQLQSQV